MARAIPSYELGIALLYIYFLFRRANSFGEKIWMEFLFFSHVFPFAMKIYIPDQQM